MKTSIATVTMSGELDAKLRAIAEARFDGVEIFGERPPRPQDAGGPFSRGKLRFLDPACGLLDIGYIRNGGAPGRTRNYYDDVEARFGLEPDFAERLRAANILYDRDEGFFFEIVERRGYRGYGAPNAIFRIAAQKRHIRPEYAPAG